MTEATSSSNEFVGSEEEENPRAVSAGEEDHENPWEFADLDAPNSPPSEVSE